MVDFPASHLWLQEGMLQVALDSGDHHHIYFEHQSVAKKHDRNNGALAKNKWFNHTICQNKRISTANSGFGGSSCKTNGLEASRHHMCDSICPIQSNSGLELGPEPTKYTVDVWVYKPASNNIYQLGMEQWVFFGENMRIHQQCQIHQRFPLENHQL